VEQGGHTIPEERIRERYVKSRLNLIRLLPKLTELLLYDNSEEADPRAGEKPEPKLLLRPGSGQDDPVRCDPFEVRAQWAKPIVAAATATSAQEIRPAGFLPQEWMASHSCLRNIR